MPSFQYIARTPQGQQVTGVLQGDSEVAVLRLLDERQLFPVSVSPQAGAGQGVLGGMRGVSRRDLGVIYGQLADLLRAGVPLLRALDTLARSTSNRAQTELLTKVKEDIAGGQNLADAMAAQPQSFTPLHVAMVRAGERGGFVEDVLSNLAQFMERQDELIAKVRGSMIYPLILMVIGTVVAILALVMLVPNFKPLFQGVGLPLPTRVLFTASDVVVEFWPLVLGVALLAVFGVLSGLKSDAGRRVWDRWQMKVPVFGVAVRMVAISRFCRILGTMLANGVPLLQALAISKDAAGSPLLADSIQEAAESVRSGQTLAMPLRASGLFPLEIVEMIAVAEESNQLEKVLVQIADTVERRTNRSVDVAVRLIEPLILLVIAGVIGFLAVGLLYPIFTMAQSLK